jgi:hypothetical protein
MIVKTRSVEREADLARISPGESVKVSLDYGEGTWMTYEGIIDGKDAFMTQGIDEGERRTINSWRSERKYLQFGSMRPVGGIGRIIFSHLHTDLVVYDRVHPEFDRKERLLEGSL